MFSNVAHGQEAGAFYNTVESHNCCKLELNYE